MIESYCGLCCSNCEYREQMNCPGCIAIEAKPFWGECPVGKCTRTKTHKHCGECTEFPCKKLTDFSNDPENGDNPKGARIEQCRKWMEEKK